MTKSHGKATMEKAEKSTITESIGREILECVRVVAKSEILPRYRRLSAESVQRKSSYSDLVTIADELSEKHLTQGISSILPAFEILGEEAVAADPSKLEILKSNQSVVIIDPIDGTWNYANGLPLFGVIIAIVEAGRTTFGALYDPLSDDWIVAHEGKGAFYGAADGFHQQVRVVPHSNFETMTGFVPLFLVPKPLHLSLSKELISFDRISSLRCSSHEYRLLSEGRVAFGLSGLLKPWDHAAGELIHREAGGYSALLRSGLPYSPVCSDDQLLLAPDEDTWHALRDKLSCLWI